VDSLAVIADLLAIARAIVDAIAQDDDTRVEDILPAELQSDLALAAARAAAATKFGPRH
jgi:hypothetical protein